MFSWITANIGTIVVALILLFFVGLIAGFAIKNKKKGRYPGCSCGCGGCAMEDRCHRDVYMKGKG